MTLEGESTVFRHGRAQTLYITIPSMMAQDSACPFKVGDKVRLEIRGDEIVLKKMADITEVKA